jgi:hypothetical protein
MRTLDTRDVAGGGGVSPRLRDERYAAAYLATSLSTLRRMRARRARGETGPEAGPAFVRIMATAVRYDQKDLDSWVESLPRAGGGGRAA